MEGWHELYNELGGKLTQEISQIQWLDLWHNQIGFLVEEHPFPIPAVFLAFRILDSQDLSDKTQKVNVQVDVYYFYETFLDSFQGAYNQQDAMEYLTTISDIHKVLHGSSGTNYSEMRRVGFKDVDTGSAGNLYLQSFACLVIDDSAAPNYDQAAPGDISYGKGESPAKQKGNDYLIP